MGLASNWTKAFDANMTPTSTVSSTSSLCLNTSRAVMFTENEFCYQKTFQSKFRAKTTSKHKFKELFLSRKVSSKRQQLTGKFRL